MPIWKLRHQICRLCNIATTGERADVLKSVKRCFSSCASSQWAWRSLAASSVHIRLQFNTMQIFAAWWLGSRSGSPSKSGVLQSLPNHRRCWCSSPLQRKAKLQQRKILEGRVISVRSSAYQRNYDKNVLLYYCIATQALWLQASHTFFTVAAVDYPYACSCLTSFRKEGN